MASVTSNFASIAAINAASDLTAGALAPEAALVLEYETLQRIYYTPVLFTGNASQLNGDFMNGNTVVLRGSNLLSYPNSVTSADFQYGGGPRVVLTGSVSQAFQGAVPTGTLNKAVITYDGGVTTINGLDNVADAGFNSMTSFSIVKNGVTLTYSGSFDIQNGFLNGDYYAHISGTITAMSMVFGGSSIALTGLTLDYASLDLPTAGEILATALSGDDLFNGTASAEALFGFDGNDTLNGLAGNDTMTGGTGDDVYIVDSVSDVVVENADEGIDRIQTALATFSLSALVNVENLTYTGAAAFTGTGNTAANSIVGAGGNDTLDGGSGDDTLAGGGGNDTYLADSAGDVVVEAPGAGIDVVRASASSYTLGANVEQLVYTGSGNFSGTGNALANTITGGAGNDTLNGAGGIDSLVGGGGDDTYVLDVPGDIVVEAAGSGSGTDTVQLAFTTAGGSYTLAANVENAVITAAAGIAVNLTGNALDNVLTAHGAADTLDGGLGNDTVVVLGNYADYSRTRPAGNDLRLRNLLTGEELILRNVESVQFQDGTRAVAELILNVASPGNDLINGDGDNNLLEGLAGNDTLNGLGGNDTLIGGAGIDSLVGGLGNDTYEVDVVGDVIAEAADEGTDQVNVAFTAAGTYVLAANVENATVVNATAGVAVTGNTLANTLRSGTGNNTLTGLGGDDTYVIDSAADVVVEAAGGGTDQVNLAFTAAGTYTLTANVENALVTSGSGVAVNVTGNDLANTITGNGAANSLSGAAGNDTLDGGAGNDTLDGGLGNDSLVGGTGDDVFIVDSLLDSVVENAGEGIDTVQTALVAYSLATLTEVENLRYTGTFAFSGTGNTQANEISGAAGNDSLSGAGGNDTLTGNAGNDTLDGGTGDDSLVGGLGDDSYLVDSAGDVVVEALGAGLDTVRTSLASYTLGANLEALVYTGGADFAGTGNALANTLTGGAGNDTLDGGAGIDSLIGGLGNDTYVLDTAADVVVEGADPGIDTVQLAFAVAATYAMAANVENAQVTAAATVAVNVAGNALDNQITGNAAANGLSGGVGNDTLNGGGGNDTLDGGAGDDLLNGQGGNDTASFATASSTATLSLDGQGRWLVSSAAGVDTLQGVESLLFTDGTVMLTRPAGANEVRANAFTSGDQLVNAAAGLAGGGHVVAWTSMGQDGSSGGVYLQRYDVNGVAQGAETRVSVETGGSQQDASVTALADGGFVVTWTGPDGPGSGVTDIYAQRYDSAGNTAGAQTRVNSFNTSDQNKATVSALADGGYVVAWTTYQQGGFGETGVQAQRFDSQGNLSGAATNVAAVTGFQAGASVAGLADGSYVVTWLATVNPFGAAQYGVFAQRFSSQGAALGGATTVIALDTAFKGDTSVAALADGGFVVTWQTSSGSGFDIFARRFTSTGTASTAVTRVNTTTAQDQMYASVSALTDGGYVIAWQSFEQDGSAFGIYQQRYNAAGSAVGGETRVNTTTAGSQNMPAVAALDDGGYLVSWHSENQDGSGYGVYSQRYDSLGTPVMTGLSVRGNDNANTLRFDGSAALSLLGVGGNDSLISGSGNDTLDGGAGNDTLDGGTGSDSLVGGLGDDTYVVDNAGDVLVEAAGAGIDTVRTTLNNFTLSQNFEQLVFTGSGDFSGTGNALANALTGGTGNDTLDGGAGVDSLVGGLGNDVYVLDTASDIVNEAFEAGTDEVRLAFTAAGSYTLTANVENATVLSASNIAVNVTGNALNNVLTGSAGNNSLVGLAGNDTLVAGGGTDTLDGGDGSDTVRVLGVYGDYTVTRPNATDTLLTKLGGGSVLLRGIETVVFLGDNDTRTMGQVWGNNPSIFDDGISGTAGNDSILANTGNDTVLGLVGNDTLVGEGGNDSLDGGEGVDSLVGGAGNDTYVVDSSLDVVVELAGGGIDLVNATSAEYTLSAEVENLSFIGSGNFTGTGNALANVITGGAGDDSLNGGAGTDTLVGGTGDDVYTLDVPTDVVNEALNAGNDLVNLAFTAAATYTMAANVERATVTSTNATLAVSITGNDLANTLTGNAGNNVLSGGIGNDTLVAGAGNDSLLGGTGDDVFDAGTGVDTVDGGDGSDVLQLLGATFASKAYVFTRTSLTDTLITRAGGESILIRNVERFQFADGERTLAEALDNTVSVFNDTVTGTASADSINGLAGNDSLIGLGGNDTLNGDLGVDTLIGGDGDDTYIVDVAADLVTESANQGVDQVNVSFTAAGTYVMTANVENATITNAVAGVNVTGNELANVITGGAGANVLAGGAGNDTLIGGIGSDTLSGGLGDDEFWLDLASDVVLEAAGEGNDTAKLAFTSTSSYTMTANVENAEVAAAGSFAIHITGNALANVIKGHAGNNSLSGLDGNDTLISGGGNDTLDGGNGTDQAELLGVLTDYAISRPSATVTLFTHIASGTAVSLTNVEMIRFAGDSSPSPLASLIALTGSPGNDTLLGTTADDTLFGALGNDSLVGGAGNDDLQGGDGLDTLAGGAGNDILDGGAGNDTYLFGVGDGDDIIDQNDAVSTGDVAVISAAVGNYASGETTLTRGWHSYNDLVINVNSGAPGAESVDHLVINDFFLNDALNSAGAIDQIRFAVDNSTLSQAQIMAELLKGTAGDDWLRGYEATADSISGGAGNDTIGGAGGNDTLSGGLGNDSLMGDAGNDSLTGDSGNDTLMGGEGNDMLAGGSGNDWMNGGNGNDGYVYAPGGGQDTISDSAGDADFVSFAAGVLAAGTQVARSGNDLTVKFAGSPADMLTLTDYFAAGGSAVATGTGLVEKFNFADGSSWTSTAVLQKVLAGTTGDDFLSGYAGGENLSGGDGNDTIYGWQGNDVINGGDGNDVLVGGQGNDTLTGGAGADRFVLDSLSGIDTITDFLAGTDKIAISKSVFTQISGNVGDSATLASLGLTYNAGTGQLLYDADGGGAGAPQVIALIGISTHPATLGADFLITA